MGGPSTKGLSQIEQSQMGLAGDLREGYQQDIAKGRELTQPLIQQQTALASGDRSAAISAAMPMIGPLSSGFNAAKANIMNTIPPGAARDQALAQLEVQKTGGISSTMAQLALQAPQILAGVGSGFAGLGMQEAGGATSGFAQAASTEQAKLQAENAAKTNTLGFFSSLAGIAGSAVTGGLTGGAGGGARAAFNPSTLSAGGAQIIAPPNIYTGGGTSPFAAGGAFWPGR